MKDLKNRVQEKIRESKFRRRCLALMLALSMFVVFIVPYEMVLPAISMTGEEVSEVQQEEENGLHLTQLSNTNLSKMPTQDDWISEAYTSPPNGAADFSNQIDDISIVVGEGQTDTTINAGNAAETEVKLQLHYEFTTNTVVNTNQKYIYYQITDKNIIIEKDFAGDLPLRDTAWNSSVGNANDQIAGYYSISKSGLIVIKFTDAYIADRINNKAFKGSVAFDGKIGRNGTASGDQIININGHEVTVEFDDMLTENSKDSQIIKNNNNDMVIHYTVTVNNPGKKVALENYKLEDTKFSDANRISNIRPEGIGTLENGAFLFNTNANNYESFTFEYDYQPTAEEIASGAKIRNQATIVNKTNPDDKASSNEKETGIPESSMKANIKKSGKASYLEDITNTGYIEWEIEVSRDYNFSLDGYTITDEAFGWDTTEIVSVVSENGGNVYFTKDGNHITLSGDTDKVVITYRTYQYKDSNGTLINLKGKENLIVSNTATVTPPGKDTPDNTGGASSNYSEASSVTKTGGNITIGAYEQLEKPESQLELLTWKVDLTNFHGFEEGSTYVDILENTDVQYYTQDQINAIQIPGLTKGSDYSITEAINAEGKIIGFTLKFERKLENVNTISFSYQSTMETADINNNSSIWVKNKGEYDNTSDDGEYTVNRENANVQTRSLSAFKDWIDVPETLNGNPVYLMLQYRTESSSEWKNYPENNPYELAFKGYGNVWWSNVPKTTVNGENYYYRVVEMTKDENGNYIEQTPEGFDVTYSFDYKNDYDVNAGYNANENSNGGFKITNSYQYFTAQVNKNWQYDKSNSDAQSTVRPETVTFTLYEKEGENGSWTVSKTSNFPVNKDGTTTTIKFENLPKTKIVNGQTVTMYYQVIETPVNDYTTTYENGLTEEQYKNQTGMSQDNQNMTITNTYNKMVINAKKNWVGDEGAESNRPASVSVHLERTKTPDNENSWETIETAQLLTAGNNWSCNWNELPKKDSDGNTFYYRVREDTEQDSDYTDQYETEYIQNAQYNADFAVNNVWKFANITPKKSWIGDTETTRTDIEVKLQYRHKKDGNWVEAEWQDSDAEHKTISKNTSTANAWTKLPRTDEQGDIYYRAVEVNVPEKYVETYDETGLNVTGTSEIKNTLNTISITPAKLWSGDEGHTDKREAVTCKLQQSTDKINWTDVEHVSEITISSGSGDKWTTSEEWKELPKTETDSNGVRKNIYYRIIETSTDKNTAYTASNSTSRNDSGEVSITNIYNNIKITTSKTWSNDTADNRPANLTVYLEQSTDNGASWSMVADSEKTVEIDKSQSNIDLTFWDDLPKTTADGKTISYRVVESPVTGYTASYSPVTISGSSGTISITNTKKSDYEKKAITPEPNINDAFFAEYKEISKLSAQELTNVPKKDVEINGETKSCYIFRWQVKFPANEIIDYVDTLPENSVFYMEEFREGLQKNDTFFRPVSINTSTGGWGLRDNEVAQYFTYPYAGDSSKLNIHYHDNTGNVVIPNQDWWMAYFTATPVEIVNAAIGANGYYSLTNSIRRTEETEGKTAELMIGSKAELPAESSVIEKGYLDRGSNSVYAQPKFTVEINPESKKLSSEDFLDITDIFKVTGYQTSDGTKYTEEGLLDAIISYILVEDMDNLNAEGEPTPITDYVYNPEYNKVNTENVVTNYPFEKFSIPGKTELYMKCTNIKPGKTIKLTIEGEPGLVIGTEWTNGGAIYYKHISDDGQETDIESFALPTSFKIGENGTTTLEITIPDNKEINYAQFQVWDNNAKDKITSVSGVSEETITQVESAVINFQVPDERHLRITYYYDLKTNENTPGSTTVGVKPPSGSKVFFQNEASVNTSDGKKTDKTDENSFVVSSSSADVTTSNSPSIEKVNIGNYSENNLEATFKLAKYLAEENKWVYATEFTPKEEGDLISYGDNTAIETENHVPAGAADLVISSKRKMNLEANVLYKLVEVASPDTYVQCPYQADPNIDISSDAMKGFVFYFVYNGKASDFKDITTEKIMQIPSSGTIEVPNSKLIDISVSKSWTQVPNGTPVKSTFTLYYSETRSSTIPASNKLHSVTDLSKYGSFEAEKTAEFDVNGNTISQSNIIEWKNLPNGKDGKPIYYYVVETSYQIGDKVYQLKEDGSYRTESGETGEYKGIYSGNGLNKDGEIEYTNVKGLYVRKEWKNSDGSEMAKAPVDKILFTLQGRKTAGGEWETIELTEEQRTLREAKHWQVEIPSEKLTGYVDFQVIENLTAEQSSGVLYGYVVSYIKNLNGNSGVLEISNKNPWSTTTSIIVRKEWEDGLSEHDGIEVTLYQTTAVWANISSPTADELEAAKEIETITLGEGTNGWFKQWSGLENIQDSGQRYYYYVIEKVPEGYVAAYDKSGTNSVQVTTITNTPEEKPGELNVIKEWEKVSTDNVPEEIILNLYRRKKALRTEIYNIPSSITVSCIGDSITENSMGNDDPNGTYPIRLAEALKVDTSKVVNRGHNQCKIEGLTTADANIDYNGTPAGVVCLMIGTNNILNSTDTTSEILDKLKTYINSIKTENNVIFVASIPDIKTGTTTDGKNIDAVNEKIKAYNTGIEALVKEYNNKTIQFVNMNSALTVDLLADDGLHPVSAGCKIIADTFYKAIGNYYGVKKLDVADNTLIDIEYVPSDLTEADFVQEIKLTAENGWKEKLSGLENTFTENGFEYQWIYYVEEVTSGTDWKVTYLHNGQPANGQMAIKITNTGDEEISKLPVQVKKLWQNADGTEASVHPDVVQVQLYSAKEASGPWTEVGKPVTLKADDWSYTWTVEQNLYYKAEEVNCPKGWTASISGNIKLDTSTEENPQTITVINTLDTGKLQVKKSWSNDDASVDSVQVELYRVAVDESGNPVTDDQSAEQTGNTPESARTFSSSSGLLSFSRFKRAIAELETEQETSQNESEEVIPEVSPKANTLTLHDLNTDTLAKATKTHTLSGPFTNNIYYTFDIGETITKIEIVLNTQTWFAFSLNQNTNYCDSLTTVEVGGKDSNNTTVTSISDIIFWGGQDQVKEIHLYYTPTGPSIELSGGGTVILGDTVTLTPTVSEGAAVSYSSSDSNIATVNDGEITFVGTGTVTITATATDATGSSNSASVDYTVSPFKITGNTTSESNRKQLQEGQNAFTLQTNASSGVTWSSSNPDILSVNEKTGEVTVKSYGNAEITATRTFGNNQTVIDTIYYTVTAKGFPLEVDKTLLHVGNTANVNTGDVTGVTLSSSDTSILIVENGVVKAVGNGTAEIIVRRGDTEKRITITVAPLGIKYNSDVTAELKISKNINEKETINFVNAIGTVTGASSNPTVASVEGTTIQIGTLDNQSATVTFTDEAGGMVTVIVTVNEIQAIEPDIPAKAEKLTNIGSDGVITISAASWVSQIIDNLPLTDGKGNAYQYYIKEITDSTTEQKYIPISYIKNGEELSKEEITQLALMNKSRNDTPSAELPDTGGYGTRQYTAIGLGFMALSITIPYIRRKRRTLRKRA